MLKIVDIIFFCRFFGWILLIFSISVLTIADLGTKFNTGVCFVAFLAKLWKNFAYRCGLKQVWCFKTDERESFKSKLDLTCRSNLKFRANFVDLVNEIITGVWFVAFIA